MVPYVYAVVTLVRRALYLTAEALFGTRFLSLFKPFRKQTPEKEENPEKENGSLIHPSNSQVNEKE